MHSEMESGYQNRAFERAGDLFGLLSAPTRLRIVCELMEAECNVSELVERLAVSQPTMSQHLGALYRAGILGRRRHGAQVFYRVDHKQARSLCDALVPCNLLVRVAHARCRYRPPPAHRAACLMSLPEEQA